MTRMACLLAVGLMVLATTGCAENKAGTWSMTTADGKVHKYDYETARLTGWNGKVRCHRDGKEYPAGQWYAKYNAFMLPGVGSHLDNGKTVPNGTYCPRSKQYVGVPGMVYDETIGEPRPYGDATRTRHAK